MKSLSVHICFVAGVLSLLLAACGGGDAPARKAASAGDPVVASVDGRSIYASDVKAEAVAQGIIRAGDFLEASSDLFRRVLEELIAQKLMAAEAVKRGLDKGPEAQKRLAAARDRVLGGLLTDRVVAEATTEEQIGKLYAETANAAQVSEQVKVSHIVVRSEAEARAVVEALNSGTPFETVALDRSMDAATRFRGGELGGYARLDLLPPAYGEMLKDARPGQLVGPFIDQGAFVILKLVDRRQEVSQEIDQVRPQIVRYLTYDQVRDLLENLRGKAKIEINLPKPAVAPPIAPAAASVAAPAVSATPSSTRAGVSVDGTPASRAPAAK